MKNLRLLFIIATLYACTPNAVNTLPSPSKASPTNSIKPSLSSSNNPSPSGVNPSITIISPTPSPSSFTTTKQVKEMKVYSDDKYITYTNNPINSWGENFYRMLPNEKKQFKAEVIFNDLSIETQNIKWSSTNPDIVSVNNGLISVGTKLGESEIQAEFIDDNNKATTLSFKVYVLGSLKVFQTYIVREGEDCHKVEKQSEYYLERYGYVGQPVDTGITNDISKERATFNGRVYDPNLVPVEGATVSAKSVPCEWNGETQLTVGGTYVFRNAPPEGRIEITVTKDGWTTRTRSEVLKSNLTGDPLANVFDFSTIYAIQDEPEVTSLKINGQQVLSSSNDDVFVSGSNAPKNTKPTSAQLSNMNQINNVGNVPSLTSVNVSKGLEVEMTFSESVRTDDVRNYFRITSQSGFNNRPTSFTIDENYSGVDFTVSPDEKTITFKTNKAILANKEGQEARYLIDFSQAFRDKTDKSAIDRRYFRFSPTQINDYAVFSVKNDEESPKLLGITARDGGSANDTIELIYSESMELINQASYPAGLSDPLAPSNLSRQTWYRDANNVKASDIAITNSTSDNNATLIGYLSNSDTDPNQFRASYMIGRILKSDIENGTPKMSILGKNDRIPNTNPVKGNTTLNDLLRNARITGDKVLLEFSPTAFDKGDVVMTTIGRIHGSYVDRNRTPSIYEDMTVNSTGNKIEYAQIYDPAGRIVDSGNSVDGTNLDTDNTQRFSKVQ